MQAQNIIEQNRIEKARSLIKRLKVELIKASKERDITVSKVSI